MSYKISYAVDNMSSDEGGDESQIGAFENKSRSSKQRVAASKSGAPARKKQPAKGKNAATSSVTIEPDHTVPSRNVPRKPLNEISNASASASTSAANADAENADEFDQLPKEGTTSINVATMSTAEVLSGGADNSKAKTKGNKGRPRSKKDAPEIPETQQEQREPEQTGPALPGRKRGGRSAKSKFIPETQTDAMDADRSFVSVDGHDAQEQPEAYDKRQMVIRKTAESRAQEIEATRKRGGATSDTERSANDPKVRRKLGQMTKQFEALELKYNELRDTATNEAESNFDKLKRQADERNEAANDLITSLRAEVAAQKAVAADTSMLKAEIESLTAKNEALSSEKKTLAASLTETQTEAKTLHAKLAATRSSSNPVQGNEPTNNKNGNSKLLIVSSAEAAKEAQKRMLKEDLYSDLTGLIVLDVKRREDDGEDVYDCIQTGRNGTLHFHLTVANTTSSGGKSNGNQTSYQDAEFQYTPLLDENRDKELMEILPDYLTEEICFPRNNAAKFYSRVADCLTKRVEIVDVD